MIDTWADEDEELEVEDRAVVVTQGIQRVFASRHPEILLEGPTGTGKTFGLGLVIRAWCDLYPGIRILVVRQTRMSMNESFLQLWEEEILGLDHPAVADGAERENRKRYVFPLAETEVDGKTYRGRSRVVLGGMDNPTRVMSTNYDIIVFIEATEGTLNQWEYLSTRNRLFYAPFNLMIADCNPGHEYHWLNVRAEEDYSIPSDLIGLVPFPTEGMKRMQRIRTTLEDNPKYYDHEKQEWKPEGVQYKLRMEQQTGANYGRFVRGEWVSSEGQVYGDFSSGRHVVNGKLERRGTRWWLVPIADAEHGLPADFEERMVEWFGISVDDGFSPDPAVVQLWAFDESNRAFLIKEHYRLEVPREERAKWMVAWQKTYSARAIVKDHDPDDLRLLNEMMGHKVHGGKPIAQNADKAIVPGIDVTRWALQDDDGEPDEDGNPTRTPEPRLRIFSSALEHEDQMLRGQMRPTCTVREFGSYTYIPRVDGKTYKSDTPDPKCEDHGMDAMRYMMMYAWRHRHQHPPEPAGYKPGTMGAKFNHAKRFRDAARRKPQRR